MNNQFSSVTLHTGIWIFDTFSAILKLIRYEPGVSGGENWSSQRKTPPNPKSLSTSSQAPAGIRTGAVVRDSWPNRP